jgi:hypothetical protein
MLSPKEQHAESAKKILARREGKTYTSPAYIPSSQYDDMAQKIVKRQEKEVANQPLSNPDSFDPAESTLDYELMTKADIKNILDEKGIPYPVKATKDELIALNEGG